MTDWETDAQLNEWRPKGHNGWGVGPQIRGPVPSPAFSIKPKHTGNNLWTWPSNSPAPALSPGSQPLPPPNCIKLTPSTPLTLWPTTHTPSWQDKRNVTHAKVYVYYVCTQTGAIAHIHSHIRSGPLCSHWGVSGYSSALAQRWVIKKSNTVNAQGHHEYQYIIQKGGQMTSHKPMESYWILCFSLSRYPWMHQSEAVDNWIKKETWLTSSSKKLELPAIWRLETLMGFFGGKNYLWHLHSSASCLHFN